MKGDLKRPARRAPSLDTVIVIGEDAPQRRPGEVEHGVARYHPSTDELTVQLQPGSWLRLSPGKRFAGELATLMAEVEAEVERPPATVATCESCGAQVRRVGAGDELVALDLKPDENGIYVLLGENRARMLREFEEPAGPTFARHRCT